MSVRITNCKVEVLVLPETKNEVDRLLTEKRGDNLAVISNSVKKNTTNTKNTFSYLSL